ncbi:glutamate receptor ionotropic, kainate 2-like isoform X1 [Centruroides sculpturatus]|uniref:glutamate receptor ionotropic, kainate 2-like isoform X1 n=1 Tax=Centruroides sculpturatus TaxID=218467 RepID=UPI000C6E52C1|nr:glutamate receptor ionotropic, kainate 2-like isoform X1 [Centruroides sculpturatus]
MKLRTSISIVKKNDGFFSAKRACEMVNEGVAAIFGPQSVRSVAAVQEVTESVGIPLIINRWEYRTKPNNTTVFLHPHADVKGYAFRDFIESKRWKSFAIIYQDPKALIRLSAVLSGVRNMELDNNLNITIKQLEHPQQLRKIFKETKKMNIRNYIIDIGTQDVIWVLEQAKEMNMIDFYHNFFFTSLDVHTQDFKQFQGIYCNITMFQIVNTNHYQYKTIIKEMETGISHIGVKEKIKPYLNTTQFALMYDAVFYFATALTKLGSYLQPTTVSLSCNSTNKWSQGKIIIDAMKSINYEGLTGVINLDENGFRTNFNLLETRLLWGKLNVEGNWNRTHKFTVIKSKEEDLKESKEILSTLILRVSAIESEPYFKKVENSSNDEPIFQGHSIDLVEELAKIANFSFKFQAVADGQYGTFENGEWNGMIGELIRNEADMVVADLSVTQDRQSAVDFTAPYMNLGVGILFKKPSKKADNFFSFLSPFSVQVWFYMATAILGVTIVMYVMGRFTPYEWENPHPCDQNPEELDNQFTLQETAWLVVGCVMQGGGDIDPKATSTRMAIGYWWFFTLIMVSSYTANLAAFLTAGRMETAIKNAEDLVNQQKIQYGCVKGGSTEKFFKYSDHPTYSRMWTTMESAEPKVFVSSNDKGKERVKKGNYAFFMESTSIDYAIVSDCGLMKIGDSLDEKSYAIATPKGSPIRESLSHALLKLQEQGITKLLKRKWWKSKQDCPSVPPPSDTLGVENIGGVFLILTIGLPLASIVVLVEFYWEKRKIPQEERKPICIELCKELKATVMGKNTVKTAPIEPEDEEKIISSKPTSSSLTSTTTDKSTAVKRTSLSK